MIKVGIIGCGKMADNHVLQVRRIRNAKITAVCDAEPLMACQMAERFQIESCFTDVEEMVRESKLDVVHITTPPQSHYALGMMCLEAGCNVYMEKPFAINTSETLALIKAAEERNLKIIAGHNAQFTPVMVRMRELVEKGFLGGPPVHLESYFGYEFGDAGFAQALIGDENHWVRKLPGSLLQNIISHGISKLAEFIRSDNPAVVARGFTSGFLKEIGQGDIIDEVRVIIQDADNTTAYFTFSSQISPSPHQLRIYGPRNSIFVDDDHQTLITMEKKEYKSYLRFFIPPLQFAKKYRSNFFHNVTRFITRDFFMPNDAGLKALIESFYRSVASDDPMPIPYREIILTSRIMDSIFEQIDRPVQGDHGS